MCRKCSEHLIIVICLLKNAVLFFNWFWKRGIWRILENDHYWTSMPLISHSNSYYWTSMSPISHSNSYYWTSMPLISHSNSYYWTSTPILSQSEKLLYVLSHPAGLLSRKNYDFWIFGTYPFSKSVYLLILSNFSKNGSPGNTTMLNAERNSE